MTPYNPGDVLLLPFPFTSLSSSKKRPAVVVSPVEYHALYGDLVLMALTSQVQSDGVLLRDWQQAGLPKPTWVKPLIGTFACSIVDKRLGCLTQGDWGAVRRALSQVVAPSFMTFSR